MSRATGATKVSGCTCLEFAKRPSWSAHLTLNKSPSAQLDAPDSAARLLRSFGTLAVVGAACLGAARSDARAQGAVVTVTGIAFDSMRMQPLRGALISISLSTQVAIADNNGSFRFDSVPTGRYSLTAQHDSLDTIGLSSIETHVAVTDGREVVRLTVPAFGTLWRTTCGGSRIPTDTGFLFGTIRSAGDGHPIARAVVVASWSDLTITQGGRVTQTRFGGRVVSDSRGNYAICGIPIGVALQLRFSADSGAAEAVDFYPPAWGVSFLNLLITATTDSARRGSVNGFVHNDLGLPVSNASVRMLGSPAEVRSGDNGWFVLPSVSIGTRQVVVQSIGSEPMTSVVNVSANTTTMLTVVLRKTTTLGSVRIVGLSIRQRWLNELENRRALGIARVVDSTTVGRRGTIVGALLDVSSVRVSRTGDITFAAGCRPTVMIDRREVAPTDVKAELGMLSTSEIGAVEVYPHATMIPTEFWPRRGRPCAAVLIWTKRMFP